MKTKEKKNKKKKYKKKKVNKVNKKNNIVNKQNNDNIKETKEIVKTQNENKQMTSNVEDKNSIKSEKFFKTKEKKEYTKVKKYFKVATVQILILFCVVLVSAITWVYKSFNSCTIESILFQLSQPLDGTDPNTVKNGIVSILVPSLIGILLFNILYFLPVKKIPKQKYRNILLTITLVSLLSYSIVKTKIIGYILRQIYSSYMIEENYVDPNSVAITFPENKRNLIYIVLESMENSYADYNQNGCMEKNLIPEITSLMEKNINFSNNSNVIGGFKKCSGTEWTVGALVAQSTGLPLKISAIGGNNYGKYKNFLPGATSLRRNS